jgi:hypothetical protein
MKYHFQAMISLFLGFRGRMWPRPLLKTMRALFVGLSQNLTVMASKDNATLVSRNNARIVFGAVSESRGDDLPKRCCPCFERQCAHCFRGRLSISRRRLAEQVLLLNLEFLGGVMIPCSKYGPKQLPLIVSELDKSTSHNAASEGGVQWRQILPIGK